MIFKRLILIFALCFFTANAKENYNGIVIDEVTSIYDGDTFRANIRGYPSIVGERMPIRINGIDTPEMRGKCTKEKTLA